MFRSGKQPKIRGKNFMTRVTFEPIIHERKKICISKVLFLTLSLLFADQRLTFAMVSVLLGLSVALAPVLQLVPSAILFGIFLYMGVSSINGIQFFDRIFLLLMPVKHHPRVSYVRKVGRLLYLIFLNPLRSVAFNF